MNSEILMDAKELKPSEVEEKSEHIYELKYDGSRHFCILQENGEPSLLSKREVARNGRFPHIINELKSIEESCVLDGEIYVDEQSSVLDLNSKENWDKASYCVFDIIEYEGKDITDKPLKERREILKSVLSDIDNVHIPKSWNDFKEAWNYVEENKLEGLMVKDLNSKYHKGKRSDAWIKVKKKENCDVKILGHEEGKTKGSFLIEMPDGTEAKVSGTSEKAVKYYKEHKPEKMEISYSFITKSGKPFQPVFEKFIKRGDEK